MALRLGDLAPDFEQDSSLGVIRFHKFLGDQWGLFVSHPADYTPVCTTELGTLAAMKPSFDSLGFKILALSVDSTENHQGWIPDIEETCGKRIQYPILADTSRKIAKLYGMIHPNDNTSMTARSVFVIDPEKRLRLIMHYPSSTGRNFEEVLRVCASLKRAFYGPVATPSNWQPGQEVVLDGKDNQAFEQYGSVREVKPYLRYVQDPLAEPPADRR